MMRDVARSARTQAYDDVRIREVAEGDIAVFFAFRREPEAARMANWAPWEYGHFVTRWAEMREDPAVDARTITVDGRVAGDVVCWERDGVWEVGYWIGRAYWGRGVATTALALALCRLTARPVYAYVPAHNAGSLRVLEKCGFRRIPEADRVTVGEDCEGGGGRETTLLAHVLEF